MFNIHKFIDLIRDRPSLWNKNDAGYNDNINRDLAWYEIGESMFDDWLQRSVVDREEQGKMLRDKWKHLRDCYNRSRGGAKSNKRKTYVYAESLKFLSGTAGNRNDSDNSRIPSKNIIEDDERNTYSNGHTGSGSNIGHGIISEANESCSSDTIEDTYQDLQPSLPPAKKFKNTNQPTVSPNKQNNLRPRKPTSDSRQQSANLVEASSIQEEDPDLMFFNSLLPDYKELDEEDKLDFRIKCLQFIRDTRKSRKS